MSHGDGATGSQEASEDKYTRQGVKRNGGLVIHVILLYSGYSVLLVRVVRLVPAWLQGVVAELASDIHGPHSLLLAGCYMQVLELVPFDARSGDMVVAVRDAKPHRLALRFDIIFRSLSYNRISRLIRENLQFW